MIKKNPHVTTEFCFVPSEKKGDLPARKSPFFSLSQLGERLAVRFAIVARLYFNIFYKSMLAKEVAMAGLKPNASVLHIGSGAYPFTAIFLAQQGYRVHACDCNLSAVDISKNLIRNSGLADRISIIQKNGCKVDSSNYDAVWVSLNICPKKRVLEQSWTSLNQGGILICRKLPDWLARFGKSDVVFIGDGGCRVRKALSLLGTESWVIEKISE